MPTKPPSARTVITQHWNTRGDTGFYEGSKAGLKTMKAEGAQGGDARRGWKEDRLKADGRKKRRGQGEEGLRTRGREVKRVRDDLGDEVFC